MKNSRKFIVYFVRLVLFCIHREATSQVFTQTAYGTVVEKGSLVPLAGATVFLLNSDPLNATFTSADGSFVLACVPVGRQSFKISYVGFVDYVLEDILITSGKQVRMEIEMEASMTTLDEVVINSDTDKKRPLNFMTLAGGRMYSIDETKKFAASFNDPSRMATSFPGVLTLNDLDNGIVIRGNSPNGLLWRMEGVDIPNPNHFASVGTSGGGISALSTQMLSNSDFLNGAFNAEYGNALSGVFDLKLRKGNNQKREYTIQAGFIGADFSAEGPIKKGHKGSYLFNYRYSTLKLISALGVDIDDNTRFQDLAYNIYLPTRKYGDFTFFGLGGISSQNEDRTLFDIISGSGLIRFKSLNSSNTGVMALSNLKIINPKINIKSTLAITGEKIALSNENSSPGSLTQLVLNEKNAYTQNKVSLSSVANIVLGKNNILITGITGSLWGYSLLEGKRRMGDPMIVNKIKESGITGLWNSYAELLCHLNTNLSINSGLHFSYLGLNNSLALEPRVSLKYDLSATQSINFGYGLHSQVQPLGVYFFRTKNQNGDLVSPNHNLGFSKAHHIIGSWSYIIDGYHKINIAGYYQQLFRVPVSPDSTNTVSILNVTEGYLTEELVNKGLGKNYGVEFSLERFLKKDFYYILSCTLFESKYKTLEGKWRNTRFNGQYAFSVTGGKEIPIKKDRSYLGFNFKSSYIGGFRVTSIDLVSSISEGNTVFDQNHAFEQKLADYSRIDFAIRYRKNFRRVNLSVSLDIQNLMDKENIEKEFYDPVNKLIKNATQNGIIPVLSIKTEF